MTTIAVTELDEGRFGVEIKEGHLRTGHVVVVSDAFLDDLLLRDVPRSDLVRETVAFMLDRQPGTAIADEVSVDEVASREPAFVDELRARLGR